MQVSALSMRLSWLDQGTGSHVFSSTSALELLPWLWSSWEPSSPLGKRGRLSLSSPDAYHFPCTRLALQSHCCFPPR